MNKKQKIKTKKLTGKEKKEIPSELIVNHVIEVSLTIDEKSEAYISFTSMIHSKSYENFLEICNGMNWKVKPYVKKTWLSIFQEFCIHLRKQNLN